MECVSTGNDATADARTFYYAKVTMIDERIGDIVRAVADRHMLDNTWTIYTSDHGENPGDHRLNQKVVFYESALKVPCIVRPLAGTDGWQSQALVDYLDLTATMLDIAAAEPLPECDGRSQVARIAAGASAPDAHTGKDVVFSQVAGYSMVHDGRYKLAVDAKTRKQMEFLDLQQDPQELNNAVNEPATAVVRSELQARYLDPLLNGMDMGGFEAFEERLTPRVIVWVEGVLSIARWARV